MGSWCHGDVLIVSDSKRYAEESVSFKLFQPCPDAANRSSSGAGRQRVQKPLENLLVRYLTSLDAKLARDAFGDVAVGTVFHSGHSVLLKAWPAPAAIAQRGSRHDAGGSLRYAGIETGPDHMREWLGCASGALYDTPALLCRPPRTDYTFPHG
jgi:hypothetical protein